MGEGHSVWVVVAGQYSDFQIVAIFSTERAAETCVALLGGDARIEEWVLDAYISEFQEGRRPWIVWMFRDGTVRNAEVTTQFPHPDEFYPMFQPVERRDLMEVCVFARNQEHAIKIASERRAIHIANQTWGIKPKEEEEDGEHER